MRSITAYDVQDLEFGVVCEDHFAGHHPEDGSTLRAQVYYVVANAPDGSRFVRYVGTWGWVTGEDEDGYPVCRQAAFHNGRYLGISQDELAEATAAMANRIQSSNSRKLNADVWVEWMPIYGSEQYIRGYWEEVQSATERESGARE